MGTHSPPPTRVSCLDRDLSRSRVRSRLMTRHESSTDPRVPPIPPITTRRDHPLDGRAPPTDRPRAVTTTTSPGRHTRARVSYRPQTTRASDVRTEYAHARALSLRRRETRDRSRGEDVDRVEYDARQPRRAGDDRARARGDDGTRERRETPDEARRRDGCEWMRARDRANAVDERRGGETGDDGDVEVAIGDLSGTTLPARARSERRRTRGWGGVWMRVGSNARGGGRVWWCGVRRA